MSRSLQCIAEDNCIISKLQMTNFHLRVLYNEAMNKPPLSSCRHQDMQRFNYNDKLHQEEWVLVTNP